MPLAEFSVGDTAILNIAVFPFSDNVKVRLWLFLAMSLVATVAMAMLSKQPFPLVKFRLEMLSAPVAGDAELIIFVGVSTRLKVKLSIGESMPPLFMVLTLVLAVALHLPVRLP